MSFYLNFNCFRGEVHFVLITFSFLLQLSFLFLIFLFFVLSAFLSSPLLFSSLLSFTLLFSPLLYSPLLSSPLCSSLLTFSPPRPQLLLYSIPALPHFLILSYSMLFFSLFPLTSRTPGFRPFLIPPQRESSVILNLICSIKLKRSGTHFKNHPPFYLLPLIL